jgi:DNA-binding MarR family transcriptional regulator
MTDEWVVQTAADGWRLPRVRRGAKCRTATLSPRARSKVSGPMVAETLLTLLVLSEKQDGIRLSELAATIALPTSKTSRLLRTLENFDLVVHEGSRYRIGDLSTKLRLTPSA